MPVKAQRHNVQFVKNRKKLLPSASYTAFCDRCGHTTTAYPQFGTHSAGSTVAGWGWLKTDWDGRKEIMRTLYEIVNTTNPS
jgi:hypothetical protein